MILTLLLTLINLLIDWLIFDIDRLMIDQLMDDWVLISTLSCNIDLPSPHKSIRSFIHDARSLWFLENHKSDFHEIRHRCSASATNLTIKFREGQVYRGHDLDLSRSREVIGHVTIFFWGGVNKKLLKHVFGLYSLPIIFSKKFQVQGQNFRPPYWKFTLIAQPWYLR